MKKELAVFTLALGLASTAPAFAGETGTKESTEKKQPVKMTEQQLDNVAGGQLIGPIIVFDVVDANNVLRNANVNVPVIAQVGLFSAQAAGSAIRNLREAP